MQQSDSESDASLEQMSTCEMKDLFLRLPESVCLNALLPFVSNHDFYVTLPSLSHEHMTLLHNDSCHRQQCRSRLGMTERQLQLFSASSFPALYQPLYRIGSVSKYHEHQEYILEIRAETASKNQQAAAPLSNSTSTSTSTSASTSTSTTAVDIGVVRPKLWWLECTRLYLHLAYATTYLTRYAPTHLRDDQGNLVRLVYQLPSLLSALIIDELTSFYAFNLLRRYMEDGYHYNEMFDSIKYYPSRLQQIHAKREEVRVWAGDYWVQVKSMIEEKKQEKVVTGEQIQTTKVYEEVAAELLQQVEGEEDEHYYLNQSGRFDESDERLQAFCEILHLGESPAAGCGAYEYRQVLWMGPALRAASDSANKRLFSSSHASVLAAERVEVVDLKSCPVVRWDTKNGNDGILTFLSANVKDWILQGGLSFTSGITARESYRLAKFIYGRDVDEHWPAAHHHDSSFASEEQREKSRKGFSATYSGLGVFLEENSGWWQEEQQMWMNKATQISLPPSPHPDLSCEQEEETKEEELERKNRVVDKHTEALLYAYLLQVFATASNSSPPVVTATAEKKKPQQPTFNLLAYLPVFISRYLYTAPDSNGPILPSSTSSIPSCCLYICPNKGLKIYNIHHKDKEEKSFCDEMEREGEKYGPVTHVAFDTDGGSNGVYIKFNSLDAAIRMHKDFNGTISTYTHLTRYTSYGTMLTQLGLPCVSLWCLRKFRVQAVNSERRTCWWCASSWRACTTKSFSLN